jgi:transposase
MKPKPEVEFAAFAGIDWADAKHDICLQAGSSEEREWIVVPHRAAAIDTWANTLRQRVQGRPVAVCLELAKGPLVYALQKHDFLVLFPVHPATLAKYRQAFTPGRAKADPTDAELALELPLRYRAKLKPLTAQSGPMRMLLRLVEQRRRLVGDQNRISSRLIDALKQYFPDVLAWFADRDTLLFCDFLTRWPTLKQLQRARRATLLSFFHEHHVRSQACIEERLHAIKSATPLTDDVAVIRPNQLLVLTLVEQLRVTLQAIESFDAEIATVSQTLPDYALFRALPGAGATLAPRLLVAFGEQRERYGVLPSFSVMPASLRSPRAVARSTGSTGDCNAPHSYGRPLSNGQGPPFLAPSGPLLIIDSNATKDAHTRRRCAPWRLNGFALSIAVGRHEPRTMSPPICMRSSAAVRRY